MPAIILVDSDLLFDSSLFKCSVIVRFQTFDLFKCQKRENPFYNANRWFLSKLYSDLFFTLVQNTFDN